MLIGFLAALGCHICCFLYPAYASYKALSYHPETSPEAMQQVERWLMYWAVVGTWTAVEAVVGWTFTWLPFYNLIKTAVFLYLSLPQSEGSSYIYQRHLAPLFEEHEADIDAFLASLRGRATTALAGGVGWAWEKAKQQLNITIPDQTEPQTQGQGYQVHNEFPTTSSQPPTLQDPASGAVRQLYGFAARYAGRYLPIAVSTLQAAAASATARQQAQPTSFRAEQVAESMSMPIPIPTPSPRTTPAQSLRSRTYIHAQAQQQQSLGVSSGHMTTAAVPPVHSRAVSTPSAQSSSESLSSTDGREQRRSFGEMSYEQINRDEVGEMPVAGHSTPAASQGNRPGMEKRRSSWFGWAGTSTPEREKTD
ncbi:TB2/DP1, HVA22 family-domain-containing protein [Naematelia encephala]|uniref:Protein YOP1 n=1 Tax=Naematelia encephala TaxID=71784 RepID=A0A1Y2BJG7_9TREE|nr:TB2/DP1, HVA22 family-domain-containing protein [Naematelia encephala]